MLPASPTSTPASVRLASLILPPLGLVLLWRSPATFSQKVIGTIGIGLYSILYLAALLWILYRYFGLGFEMRGRPIPVPTFSKNVPDFDRLEADRGRQQKNPVLARDTVCKDDSLQVNFRGPERTGVFPNGLRTNWPGAGLPLLWRQPVGGGYASFAVAGCVAFTLEQRREQEAVVAYDTRTGRELWSRGYPALFQEWMGGDGPRATPTVDAGRVYALGAKGDLHCLAAGDGAVIWHRDVLQETQCANLPYGLASSPLVLDSRVIVCGGEPLGPAARSVVAFDKMTGAILWKGSQEKMGYASPMVATLAGEQQIVVFGGRNLIGLSARDGSSRWSFPWPVPYDNNIAQPLLLSSNRLFLSSGYGTGCAAIEIRRENSDFSATILWRNRLLKNKFASSVFFRGHIYGLDEDILVCLDAGTGARKWKGGRYGYGQLLLAGDHLVILTGDGQLALVAANPEAPRELARFPAIHGKTWNYPTLAGNRILVRNSAEMACFDLTLQGHSGVK